MLWKKEGCHQATGRRQVSGLGLALVLGLSGWTASAWGQEEPDSELTRTRAAVEKQAVRELVRGGDAAELWAEAEALPQTAHRRQTPALIPTERQAAQKRFAEVEAKIRALGLEREDVYLAKHARALERLESGANKQAGLENSLASSIVRKAPPPILRSSLLPYRSLALAGRTPVTSPEITPVYRDRSDPGDLPADRSPSPTAPLSQAILAQASALEYDYVRIFEFVLNEIEREWYAGSLRGAEGTLLARRGNAVDQASLLVALLRGSGAAARFVEGVVELEIEDLRRDLGLESAEGVPSYLARSGLAFTPVVRGGSLAAVHLAHTWVAARIPYTNYRGAVVDRDGWTWIPLDPTSIPFVAAPGSGVLEEMAFDADEFRAGYLSAAQEASPLETLRQRVDAYLLNSGRPGETWSDQLATRAQVPERLGLLPTTLTFPVVAVTGEFAALPERRLATATLVLRETPSPSSAEILRFELPISEISGQRLTLSYLPATVDDHRLVLAFGGLGEVPAYLVDVRPQVKRDGRQLAIGETLPLGTAHGLTVEIAGAWGEEQVSQAVVSGSYLAINLSGPTSAPLTDTLEDPADTESLGARLLAQVAAGFAASWDASENELAAGFGVALVRPVPSLTLALTAVGVTELAGVPFDLSFEGVQLDAALRITDPLGAGAEAWRQVAALEGSALESETLEALLRVDSISTAKGLGLARDLGIEVVRIDPANANAVVPTLAHPQPILDLVTEQASAGQEIEIPRSEIDLIDWRGSVWSSRDGSTGAEGYFLAGGLRGGATVVDPADWPFPELAGAFEDPFAGEPNPDPLAGASIEVLPDLDGQLGTVDRFYPDPVGVVVRDEIGRPVENARVTFRLESGGGSLGSGSSAGPEQVTVTNARGEALVRLRAGQDTSADPVLRRRDPLDRFRHQTLRQRVSASVLSTTGRLQLETPIEAFAFAGPVETVERLDTAQTYFSQATLGLHSDTMTLSA
ncbi:MAG: transglutaminase-like domain-containing protein, partial [Acidobacteriota bacterium]